MILGVVVGVPPGPGTDVVVPGMMPGPGVVTGGTVGGPPLNISSTVDWTIGAKCPHTDFVIPIPSVICVTDPSIVSCYCGYVVIDVM